MTDFTVRYCHFDKDILAVLALADLFQIPCKEQEVPEVVLRGVHIVVSNIFVNRFCDCLSLDQSFDFLLYRDICPFHESADNAVGTGIGPVGFQQSFFVVIAGIYIIDDAPRIVHFSTAKTISVIPCSDCVSISLESIVRKHLIYFILSKTEVLGISCIHD